MKLYNPDRKCPKCGNELVRTEYRDGRLIRRCKRCLYYWSELPLDEKIQEKEDEE